VLEDIFVAILFEASPGFGDFQPRFFHVHFFHVAILFEASPGFGESTSRWRSILADVSQSSLKRVLVSEKMKAEKIRIEMEEGSQSSLKRVLVSEQCGTSWDELEEVGMSQSSLKRVLVSELERRKGGKGRKWSRNPL